MSDGLLSVEWNGDFFCVLCWWDQIVPSAETHKIQALWDAKPCRPVSGSRRFGGHFAFIFRVKYYKKNRRCGVKKYIIKVRPKLAHHSVCPPAVHGSFFHRHSHLFRLPSWWFPECLTLKFETVRRCGTTVATCQVTSCDVTMTNGLSTAENSWNLSTNYLTASSLYFWSSPKAVYSDLSNASRLSLGFTTLSPRWHLQITEVY